MDQQALLLATVAITSIAACWLVPRPQRSLRALGVAVARSLEVIGAACLFFGVNLGVAAALIVGGRRVGFDSLSPYMIGDVVLPLLSLGQGIMFVAWRAWRVFRPR